jgi:thioredoxin 2
MNAEPATSGESVLIACPHCHALVRVPGGRLAEHPKCARCKSPVVEGRPVELDAQSFEAHTARADLPVIVDFWAPWCAPCRTMAPVLERAASEYATTLQLAKVNTDREQQLAERFGIRSIPTLILFHKGRELARQTGAVDGGTFARWIESALPQLKAP